MDKHDLFNKMILFSFMFIINLYNNYSSVLVAYKITTLNMQHLGNSLTNN